MTDVKVVAPMNIGKGIKWNAETKKYEVALGKGLFLDEQGNIQLVANEPTVNTFDNGTGVVLHRQAIIDYGGLIEISGTAKLGLMQPPFALGVSDEETDLIEIARLKSIYGENTFYNKPNKVTSTPMGETTETLYYVESGITIDASQFGINQVISVSATAGDIYGYRRETAWVIDDISNLSTSVPIGIHVFYSEGQTECAVSYSIKGIKS